VERHASLQIVGVPPLARTHGAVDSRSVKKVILIIGVPVVIAIAVAVFLIGSNLGSIVKKGVETVGPRITGTTLTIEKVDLSPSSGSGTITGFVLGNPEGCKSPQAIRLGEAKLEVDPGSVLSDKIHVKSIAITDPQITIEGGLGDNNLKKILANIDAFTASEKTKAASGDSGSKVKLQVDDFTLKGARVDVKFGILGGKGLSVPIPDIHLSQLGTGADGITPGELAKKVFGSVFDEIIPAVTAQLGKLGDLGKGAINGAAGAVDKVGKGLGDLFKKK